MAAAAPTSTPVPTVEVSTPGGLPWPPPAITHSLRPYDRSPLVRLLHKHPNSQYIDTLISHLSNGFNIAYQGPHRDVRAPNLPSASLHPEVIDEYLKKWGDARRMAGPFIQSPFPLFIVQALVLSPNMTVPGESSQISLPLKVLASMTISTQSQSLLATPQSTMQFWISHLLGRDTLLAKKRAFRQCPVRQEDWHLLGLCWMGKFYHDKCLPLAYVLPPLIP